MSDEPASRLFHLGDILSVVTPIEINVPPMPTGRRSEQPMPFKIDLVVVETDDAGNTIGEPFQVKCFPLQERLVQDWDAVPPSTGHPMGVIRYRGLEVTQQQTIRNEDDIAEQDEIVILLTRRRS